MGEKMPQPINKNVGTCLCSIKECKEVAKVRRIKNERDFYLDCPVHSTVRNKGTHEYVLNNAELFTPECKDIDDEIKSGNNLDIERVPEAEPVKMKKQKKEKSFFDFDI